MKVIRYLIQKTPIGTMMKPNKEGSWVEASDFDRVTAERDALQLRLNAVEEENDRLRQESSENTIKLDALLAHCDDGECMTCGAIICPSGEPLHFHHDGCPACCQFDALEKRP